MRFTSMIILLLAAGSVLGSEVIPLYSGAAPGSEAWTNEERSYYSEIFNTEVVTNVSRPTLTAFLPEAGPEAGKRTAVIIAPGGGYHALSINSEGNDVARWLNERGVAAFVLRYRLVPSGEDGVKEMISKAPDQARQDMLSIAPLAGADGLAAMRLVRSRATEFNVDPTRIGFMGFSAGGGVAASVVFGYDAESRPDFIAPIYAGLGRQQEASVPDDAPPLFVVAASNDQLGLAKDSVVFYNLWLDAGKSAELHLFAQGGHGFGMRKQNLPSDSWIDRFGDWLANQGFLNPAE